MDVVEVAKALASPTRVNILEWLKDPAAHFVSRRTGDLSPAGVCASLIAQKAGIAPPTASRHLDVLRRTGLLESERIAGWNFHRRSSTGIARAHQLLNDI